MQLFYLFSVHNVMIYYLILHRISEQWTLENDADAIPKSNTNFSTMTSIHQNAAIYVRACD